jgi:hypothetical protein
MTLSQIQDQFNVDIEKAIAKAAAQLIKFEPKNKRELARVADFTAGICSGMEFFASRKALKPLFKADDRFSEKLAQSAT